MKNFISYLFLFFVIVTITTCRKKTSVDVTVFNYALNEPISNATVVLVEKKGESGGGIFSGNASCTEVASAVTDANGRCHFDKEKLRSSSNYRYFFGITNAYGIPQEYPCGGKTSGFIDKGKTQETILNLSDFEANLKVQFNNVLSPSQAGDTLFLSIGSPKYTLPGQPYPFGGGGVFYASPFYGCNGFPFPSIVTTASVKTNAGKNTVYVLKRKMGVVTKSIDTIKVYPNQTTTVIIDW